MSFAWNLGNLQPYVWNLTKNSLLFESIDPVTDPEGEKGISPDGSDPEAEFFLFKATSSPVS